MTHFMCKTCGTQFAASETPPDSCPICEDERQYVLPTGQQWTTMAELAADHGVLVAQEEPGLYSLRVEPAFAINQRAMLIQTAAGNILWDCVPLIDAESRARIAELGGIAAIAISHPHYYSAMVEWSRAFDAPVYLHAGDRAWVMRPDQRLSFWDGPPRELLPGVTLIHAGGHFDGAALLHWAGGAEGRGVLLTGDTMLAVADRRYVTFMRSYPNYVPLGVAAVERIVASVEPYPFDRLYSAFADRTVPSDAKAGVIRSAERYIAAIRG